MQTLKTMLEQYRNGERGLPTYEELAALVEPVEGSKFDRFVAALEALCREHQVQLCTSGYDGLDVKDLAAGEEPVYCAGIEDKTGTRRKIAIYR
jgi:hypothetical protein